MIKTNFEAEIEELLKMFEENKEAVKAYEAEIQRMRKEFPLCIVF